MTSVFVLLVWHGSYDLPSNVILQRINVYDTKNQLIIFGIDNYYVYFLLSEIYIHKKRKIYYVIILHIIKDIGKYHLL